MKFLNDIRNLDRNNVGGWPQSVKVFFTVLLFALVMLIGWYFYVSGQQDTLTSVAGKEESLKQEFASKQAKSVNLEALQQQLDEMQDMLRQLAQQLAQHCVCGQHRLEQCQRSFGTDDQVG